MESRCTASSLAATSAVSIGFHRGPRASRSTNGGRSPSAISRRLATSSYRYLLPAFRDLYGVDFDTITPEQARLLNDRIFANYKDDKWLVDVITRRANIELMFIDPYWARLQFGRAYKFSVPVLNVTQILSGTHRESFVDVDSPYLFAERRKMPLATLDDYLAVVDAIFSEAVAADVVCLKSTQAYQRTLRYESVPKERAVKIFGKSPSTLDAAEKKDFEDFMFWHVLTLSAKHGLPFQIHTGHGRLQGSSPMLLLDAIAANPGTKFVLFHGGFPWVDETAAIAMRHHNVWIDSVWLPTLSYTVAKRAYQVWLETMPSDRIMWGADTVQAEGIYAATEFTRQCLSEALAEKVERGELREDDAVAIGRGILRDNALKLFPKLKRQLGAKMHGSPRSQANASAFSPKPRRRSDSRRRPCGVDGRINKLVKEINMFRNEIGKIRSGG